MDTGEIPIPQAETEGDIDPNMAGSDSRGEEKRKSECGEEPPSTLVRLQALADSLHSVSEGDKEGVQDELTTTGGNLYDWMIEERRHTPSFDDRLVIQAKIEELDKFSKMDVYKVVPRTDLENDNDVVWISTKWVVKNKGFEFLTGDQSALGWTGVC